MSDWLLLDTNVVSFLLKKDTRAGQFEPLLSGKMLALSFMSEAELFRWSIERKWGDKQIQRLASALRRYLVLPYDQEIGWSWAGITARCAGHGKTIGPSDAWIAATACRHDMPLLTHNVKHFENAEKLCGLRLVRTGS